MDTGAEGGGGEGGVKGVVVVRGLVSASSGVQEVVRSDSQITPFPRER